jgi:hypothetical protein
MISTVIIMITSSGVFQMADSTKSATQFLQDLRKERDELNTLIQALEKRLGISALAPGVFDEEREVPPVTSVPVGFFHNLSQAAAAEKFLRMNSEGKQAYTTAQILQAFENSGMKLNPNNALTILYTALKRSPKFERVGSKAWGLKEWYPERRRKISNEKESSDSDADAS